MAEPKLTAFAAAKEIFEKTPEPMDSSNAKEPETDYNIHHNERKIAQLEIQNSLQEHDNQTPGGSDAQWSVQEPPPEPPVQPDNNHLEPCPEPENKPAAVLFTPDVENNVVHNDPSINTTVIKGTVQAIRCCVYLLLSFACLMTVAVVVLPLFYFTDVLVTDSQELPNNVTTPTPTITPTSYPTVSPTTSVAATFVGQTKSPTVMLSTVSPTTTPTTPPNHELLDLLTSYITVNGKIFNDSACYKAYEFLKSDRKDYQSKQQFGLVLLDKSLNGNFASSPFECKWLGVGWQNSPGDDNLPVIACIAIVD